jgi:uncharacterized protein (DUF2147 family)
MATASPAISALSTSALTPIGVWLFQNNRFAIEIDPCGDQLCGKVSWLKAPRDAHDLPRVDSANADPTLRMRPVLGLTILKGLRSAADGTWEGGEIYNPDDGGQYHASMSMNDDGTLRVRAFVLTPLLGKTLRLTRMS